MALPLGAKIQHVISLDLASDTTGLGAWSVRIIAAAPAMPLTVTRDPIWIGLGVVALLVYFFVLGPGIPRA